MLPLLERRATTYVANVSSNDANEFLVSVTLACIVFTLSPVEVVVSVVVALVLDGSGGNILGTSLMTG